jgi:SAM-dependent methyltransferase
MSLLPSLELSAASQTRAPDFDRLAHVYRWMEAFTFGPYLARCRSAFLSGISNRRHALVLGDGDGRFTAQLLRTNPIVQIDAVDASRAMLQTLLHRAAENAGRVRCHHSDARSWLPPDPPYDLVATHFFLDCLTTDEVHALAAALRSALSPSAVWIVSEFAVPESQFGRLAARPLIGLLYRGFGLLTGLSVRRLPDYAIALREAGFRLNRRRAFLYGLLVSEIWSREDYSSPESRMLQTC